MRTAHTAIGVRVYQSLCMQTVAIAEKTRKCATWVNLDAAPGGFCILSKMRLPDLQYTAQAGIRETPLPKVVPSELGYEWQRQDNVNEMHVRRADARDVQCNQAQPSSTIPFLFRQVANFDATQSIVHKNTSARRASPHHALPRLLENSKASEHSFTTPHAHTETHRVACCVRLASG